MATKTLTAAGLAAALLTAVGACSSGTGAGGDSTTVKVGLVNSYTGALASFGPAWEEGYRAGLKVSTSGSMTVGGVKIEIEKKNDNSNPATGLSAAKQLLGDGAKVIVGPASSAVVVPVAQLAMQNKAVFIAGQTGTADIDGMGPGVFRSSPTTPQLNTAVLESAAKAGDKSLLYLGQDYAYGQGAVTSLKKLAPAKGVSIGSVLLPVDTQDFTAGVAKALAQKPDAIFVGWAGEGLSQLFKALADQGAFNGTHIIAIGPPRPQFAQFAAALGPNLPKLELITYYGEGTTRTKAETAMLDALKGSKTPIDIHQVGGYLAAQMTVKAVEKAGAGLEVGAVNKALSGATFETPVGTVTIRAEDHVPLQPIFGYTMVKDGATWRLDLNKTYSAKDVESPVAKKIS
ncbi:substrate-binding domain-containing protein [Actinomadura madurae]|uniref:substrate-binding domain-containing protein n=1 Tax=Actinomadura madurae TaxID=1993 RepID=UPI00202752FB|nr:substrate-binding domain-containing protein [Actinomadura madurae]MCQ0017361.1 substrate-binding domain-containing protein [Actinomadura madurae]URM97464.1 substrate-binding domain-containing protein [Actinomadura madurae]URN08156.1 substrate-binding domain-containing protein [Actinomadura madurae]